MIDQSVIVVRSEVRVRPDVFTDPDFLILGHVHIAALSPRTRRRVIEQEREVYHSSSIEIFEDRALRVYTRPGLSGRPDDPGNQVVDTIEINPAKILLGHNGFTLPSDAALCLALSIARHVLGGILQKPADASLLIPGLSKQVSSCWRSIEIAMNIDDPGRVVLKLMRRMRSPHIRKKAHIFEDNTTCLDGGNIELKAYDKGKQMKNKHKKSGLEEGLTEITRLELKLKLHKYPQAFDFLPESERPNMLIADGKARLLAFNREHLVAAHRHYFSELKAVYSAKADGEDKSTTAGYGAAFAAIALRYDIPVTELLDIYMATTVRKESSCRSLRDKIEHFLSKSSTVTAADLLTDRKYACQPVVAAIMFRGHAALFPEIIGADADILRLYTSESSRKRYPRDIIPWKIRAWKNP